MIDYASNLEKKKKKESRAHKTRPSYKINIGFLCLIATMSRPNENWCFRKRDDQGLCECEVWADSFEGTTKRDLTGAEGSKEWKTCEKNPGHQKFIPAPDFGLDHLPQEYRTVEILELVQAEADLTVRLRVQHTSADRPDGYPFSNFRGQDVPHTGTGVVTFVGLENEVFTDSEDEDENQHYSDEEDDDRDEETRRREYEEFVEESKKPAFSQENCPCYDCEDARFLFAKQIQKQSCVDNVEAEKCEGAQPNVNCLTYCKTSKMVGKPSTSSFLQDNQQSNDKRLVSTKQRPCWLVIIETALHVVYDSAEARRTVVDAFYDTNSASARSQTLYGFCMEARYEEEDRCTFKCATHNEELVNKLHAAQNKRFQLNKALGRPSLPTVNPVSFESGVPHKAKTDLPDIETQGVVDKEKTALSDSAKQKTDVLSKETTDASPQPYRLAIIIGHPHGRSKTICVGQWIHRVKGAERKASVLTHYIYDTPTCNGNSGGAVMTFGRVEDERVTVAIFNHHHRSATSTPGLNMSSPSHEYTSEIFTLK